MNTVSLVGSVSRLAGGLFESVRRLHRQLVLQNDPGPGAAGASQTINAQVFSLRDQFTETDLGAWSPVPVRVFESSGPRAFGYMPGGTAELRAQNPDLVHVHGLWQFSSVAALEWHRRSGRPYVVSPHGMLDDWALRNSRWRKAWAWGAYEARHLKNARCIRALCSAEAQAIRNLGLANPICVIPNGVELENGVEQVAKPPACHSTRLCEAGEAAHPLVDAQSARQSLRERLQNRNVLLYLGRLHPKKGLENLLRAWAARGCAQGWLLVVAGWDQGGHESRLKQLATELEIAWADRLGEGSEGSSLLFAGPQFGEAKRAWLERCDAFILPSFSEGIPMAVLEAWARAKPVLMTRQCNLPEGFAEGAALCIDSEPGALAADLKEFFQLHRSIRQEMGLRGKALVARRFSWPQIATELRAVYQWMLGAGARPPCVRTS